MDALFEELLQRGEPMACPVEGTVGTDVPHCVPNYMTDQAEGTAGVVDEGEPKNHTATYELNCIKFTGK
jgi:hypothetical protein